VIGLLAAIGWALAEAACPLRPRTTSRSARLPSNAALSALTAATLVVGPRPAAMAVARRWRGGLASLFPAPWRSVVAFVAMDAAIWGWHAASHRVPLLWRFHAAHHLDPDLDVTTAFRFHPVEILLSTAFRVVQTLIVGPTPAELRAYDAAFVAAVWFHHGNVAVPGDAALGVFVITPRSHGIHHDRWQHANFGTILTLWDRLAGTFRADLPQHELRMGAGPYGRSTRLGDALWPVVARTRRRR
jgi:sterol desaturase/sphingolipid hydroxylase (fatty acid hydroxylase superfamily)